MTRRTAACAVITIAVCILATLALACGGGEPPPLGQPTGTIAYSFSPSPDLGTGIYLADSGTGDVRPLVINAGTNLSWSPMSWSPDGQALVVCDGEALWVVEANRSGAEAVAPGCQAAAWSPEGSRIAFLGGLAQQNRMVYTVRPDGTDLTEVAGSSGAFGEPSWSPDGKRLLFQVNNNLYVAHTDGTGPESLMIQDDESIWKPQWSPDGESVVYGSENRDTHEIGLVTIDVESGKSSRLVARQQPQYRQQPRWSPDGMEISYIAELEDGVELRAISPEGQGDRRIAGAFASVVDYVWSPDGNALAILEAGEMRQTEIYIVRADGTGAYQLTFDGLWKRFLAWAPEDVPEASVLAPIDLSQLPRPAVELTPEVRLTPESTPSQPSPTPGGAPIPPRPLALEQYAEVMERYLTANRGTSDCLLELTKTWDMPPALTFAPGRRCLEADTDGDGRSEIVVAVEDTGREPDPINPLGDVLIFSPVGDRYELVFSALAQLGAELTGPAVTAAVDIDGDWDMEVAFTSNNFGAHTLSTSVFVVGWDGRSYRRLTPEGLGITSPKEIRFDIMHGSSEEPYQRGLVLRGDTIGSAGAGVQRQKTYFYLWNGESFELAMSAADPSPFLYFAVLDANEAFADGRYALATGRYKQAIVDDSLLDLDPYPGIPSEQAEGRGREEVLAFAHFRLGLSYLRLGDETAAIEAVTESAEVYAETWHGKAAVRFLDTFKGTGDEERACQAMTAFAKSNLQTFQRLWDYGYGNPGFQPEALCLEPGLTPLYWSLHSWQ